MSETVRTDDGIAIEYKVYGEGPLTVLFLHAWGNAASAWDDLVTSTRNARPDDGSAGRMPDFAGCGNSPAHCRHRGSGVGLFRVFDS